MKLNFLPCRFLLTLTTCLFASGLFAGTWQPLISTQPSVTTPQVLQSDIDHSVVKIELAGFFLDEVQTSRGTAYTVNCPGTTPLLQAGAPDVSKFAVSLVIPDAGGMSVRIVSSSFTDYKNIEIAPSKGNILRTVRPEDVPYRYGKEYTVNSFWPETNANLRPAYILRDYRGQTLLINPFSYNPVSKTLRVYREITVEVFKDAAATSVNELSRSKPLTTVNADFSAIYKSHFANFPSVTYVPVEEGGKMLIICPSQWSSLIQPLVDWKIRRGLSVEVVDVITAGGTASNIQQYIANKFISSGLHYVLIVGDVAQCPTLYAQGGASDPSFGYVLGSDSYAEVMIGRFSAETDPDVSTQVQRVLEYEMTPNPAGLWYDHAVVVGSDQGPGDDNEMDWEHEANIRTDLMNFTYSNVAELYDGTHAGTTDAAGDPTHTDLFNIFQSGISMMTYTGHGSSTSCGTTGLSVSDVSNMTNTGMLPFIWSVACVNGQFDMAGGPCFAEKFLRQQYNSEPVGAIATFMSSINQSWNPPMDAQDEMVDILAQSYLNNMKFTFSGLSVNGCMHMNDQYGAAGAEMTDTWHCFGDPTLNVRTATPQLMTVSHTGSMPVGLSSLNVNCNFNGATVALSMNGQVLGTATVSGGAALVNFAPVGTPDTIFVTVTGFNQIPYLGQVLVIPASGPYVICQSTTVHDTQGNNDGVIDFSETIDLDLTLQNVGLADASNVTATLTTTDPFITIVNGVANLGNVISSSSVSQTNAFSYTVANDVPDQHVAQFVVIVSDNMGGSWSSSFSQLLNAPALGGGVLSIDDVVGGDGDGFLESGETANVIIRCLNNGHSDAPLSTAAISTFSGFLNILSGTFNTGTLGKFGYTDATFQVSMASNVAVGTNYDITLNLTSGMYSAAKTYGATAGIILEDFESNDFTKYAWTTAGSQPWATTMFQPYEGVYCSVSGNINDNESSELLINLTALADDSVTFWYKMSSEQDWDYLRFYVDGLVQNAWSGIGNWSYAGFQIGSGSHQLRFSYEKDNYLSAGSDCAWLDNIRFPYGTQVTGIEQYVVKNGIAAWPNPAQSLLNLRVDNIASENHLWTITNLVGERILTGNVATTTTSQAEVQINISSLPAGMYLLNLSSDAGTRNIKFQVVK